MPSSMVLLYEHTDMLLTLVPGSLGLLVMLARKRSPLVYSVTSSALRTII